MVVLCSFFYLDSYQEEILLYKIRNIPLEDFAILEAFFRILVLEEGGAYVLFGSKPMAFTAYFTSSDVYNNISRKWYLYSENRTIQVGWEVWKKYRHRFPSSRFVLESKPFDECRAEICLIDRNKFKKTIKSHLEDFQSIFGLEKTSAKILEEYQQGNRALFKLLEEHHAALGILLGFGRENALQFHERAMKMGKDPNLAQEVSLKAPLPFIEFVDKSPLQSAFNQKHPRTCYKFLSLPYFLADPRLRETQELKYQYLQQRRQIQKEYAHGHFLEMTLKRFCSS